MDGTRPHNDNEAPFLARDRISKGRSSRNYGALGGVIGRQLHQKLRRWWQRLKGVNVKVTCGQIHATMVKTLA